MEIKTMEQYAAERRLETLKGLRGLVEFLEAHPELPVPYFDQVNAYVETKEQMQAIARKGSWDKTVIGDWFFLSRKFSETVAYHINVERDKICTKRVVGTRTIPERTEDVVEWDCEESLLS